MPAEDSADAMSAVAAACASAASVSQSMRNRATRQHTAAGHSRGAVSSDVASHAQQGYQGSALLRVAKVMTCNHPQLPAGMVAGQAPAQGLPCSDRKNRTERQEDKTRTGAHLPQRPL